ncbi:hypothetical protein [Streptomyces acidicola]|uniref:hypothetical protein n=1 Tax=Streptomyces acidicola TaxID=2596892 RepID=UPI0037F7EC57
MHSVRTFTVFAAAVASVLVVPGAAQADSSATAAKYYYTTWSNARSVKDPDKLDPPVGRLWAGRNYFYCQTEGYVASDDHGNRNVWWARTDDDSGNRDVWISAIHFTVGGNFEPIPGLPRC